MSGITYKKDILALFKVGIIQQLPTFNHIKPMKKSTTVCTKILIMDKKLILKLINVVKY